MASSLVGEEGDGRAVMIRPTTYVGPFRINLVGLPIGSTVNWDSFSFFIIFFLKLYLHRNNCFHMPSSSVGNSG